MLLFRKIGARRNAAAPRHGASLVRRCRLRPPEPAPLQPATFSGQVGRSTSAEPAVAATGLGYWRKRRATERPSDLSPRPAASNRRRFPYNPGGIIALPHPCLGSPWLTSSAPASLVPLRAAADRHTAALGMQDLPVRLFRVADRRAATHRAAREVLERHNPCSRRRPCFDRHANG